MRPLTCLDLKANVIAGAQEGRQGRKAREEERQDSEASKEEARQQYEKAVEETQAKQIRIQRCVIRNDIEDLCKIVGISPCRQIGDLIVANPE